MNTTQVKCFLAAAQHLNFTKAAEALYMSQPVVSRQIASLEQEIGVQLFVRLRNVVVLTKAGEYLQTALSKIMADYQHAIQTASSMSQGTSGSLNIGTAEGQTFYDYYDPVFLHFWQQRSQVKVQVSYYPHSKLKQALTEGEIDIAIASSVDAESYPDVNTVKARTGDAWLVVPANHKNIGKENLTLADFKEDTFILLDEVESGNIGGQQKEALINLGIPMHQRIAPNIGTFALWLESGMGISTLNSWHALRKSDKVKFLKIDSLEPVTEVIAWRKDNINPNIKVFVDLVKELEKKNL